MSLVTNVFRRGASYYFRTRVPARFRALLERKELWRSLRTSDAREARQRASIAVLLTEALWRDLERAMSSKRDFPNPAQIRSLIDQWLRAELDEDAYLRAAPDGERHDGVILRKKPECVADVVVEYLDDSALRDFRALSAQAQEARLGPDGYLVTDISDLDLRRAAFRKRLEGAEARYTSADGSLAELHVADVFRRAGYEASPFSEAFEVATRRMIRAHRDVLGAVEQRDVARWRPELDDDPAAPLIANLTSPPDNSTPADTAVEAPVSGTTLTQAINLLLSEARQTGLFTSGRAGEYEKAGRLFIGWLGRDPDVAEVTPAMAGSFREILTSYPLNAAKRAAYRELAVPERLAKSRADQDPQTLSPQTANGKYLDPLRQVFDWTKKTGRITVNPFAGINVSVSKGQAKKRRRDDFDLRQLQTLFSAPLFTGSAGDRGERLYQPGEVRVDDWRYWLPVMALYSGARLNELCGLRLADFEQTDGVAFFHIRALAEGQTLKTEASERMVPIHKALLDLGLLTHVDRLRDAGEDRLFPSLRPGPRGHLSHTPSKFFGRLIDRMVGAEAAVVFHSFRHTFITKMREAGVPREVRTALVGHDDDSSHEGYGTEPMTRLNAGVQAVQWAGLDLSRIRLPGL